MPGFFHGWPGAPELRDGWLDATRRRICRIAPSHWRQDIQV
ncbi:MULTISPECIES: hypothetical protein [unclassified Acidovorax]|nr:MULTISPECIES: hypothetical protein [unclassified Acidovorax]